MATVRDDLPVEIDETPEFSIGLEILSLVIAFGCGCGFAFLVL